MELPLDQMRDHRRHASEPSPSPPLTARIAVPPSPQSHSGSASVEAIVEECTSASVRFTHRSLRRSSSNTNTKRQSTPHDREPFEDEAAKEVRCTERSVSQRRGQRKSENIKERKGGKLAAKPLNVTPVLQSGKRRSESLRNVPSPAFQWEEEYSVHTRDTEEGEEEDRYYPPRHHLHEKTRTSSSEVPRQRQPQPSSWHRASVVGPDPRDCIDMTDVDEENEEVQAPPSPHQQHHAKMNDVPPTRRAPHVAVLGSHPPPQQQQSRHVTKATADDLSALVNAGTVDRCRSDSRGRVRLVDSGAQSVPNEGAPRPLPSHREGRGVVSFHPSRHPSPSHYNCHDVYDDDDDFFTEAARNSRLSASKSPSPAPLSAADAASSYADCVFAKEYFYFPAATAAAAGEEEPGLEAPRHGKTPARNTSASPSSSVPRWARSLAEETPFTPFACAPAGKTATPSAAAGSLVTPPVAVRALAGQKVSGRDTPLAADDVEEVAHAGEGSGAEHEVLGRPVRDGEALPVRLTVEEVVAAVLRTSSAPADVAAFSHDTHVFEAGGTEAPDRRASTEATDEPAARPPPPSSQHHTSNSVHQPDARHSTISVPSHALEEDESEMATRLHDRMELLKSRLVCVDRLTLRFDTVIDARQQDLATILDKQAELQQQTDSHKTRTVMAQKEVRRLRDRQHAHEELHLLHDMLADKGNRLEVAQSHLLALKRRWQQLELLHNAAQEKSVASTSRRGEATNSDSNLSGALHHPEESASENSVQHGDAEGRDAPPARSSSAASSVSSLASLNTCDALDDFLEELLWEVDSLAKVCIQLPSPPPTAMSYCNRLGVHTGASGGAGGQHDGTRSKKSIGALQRSGSPSSWGQHPTYTTLNRRLNDGNNGFFSFFGGATEAHLNSKPKSTFLANLSRLARSAWEWEEELQLRARELATEQEEEELRARLAAAYGGGGHPSPREDGLVTPTPTTRSGAPDALLSPTSPLPLSDEGQGGADGVSRPTLAEERPSATRQLFLSSPEHGRRSSRGSAGSPSHHHHTEAMDVASPVLLLRHPSSPISLVLPTLVYAYPRIAAISQHLDAEQQKIQTAYAANIEAQRQARRVLTAKLRDAFRTHVAPALQCRIGVLRCQQAALVEELRSLGVKSVCIQWEEEDPVPLTEAVLGRALDCAAATQERHRRRRGSSFRSSGREQGRSPSRINAYSTARGDGDSVEGGSSSRGTSSYAAAAGDVESRNMADAILPPCPVYRRTLRVVCADPDDLENREAEEETALAACGQAAKLVSPRSSRRRGDMQAWQQQHDGMEQPRHSADNNDKAMRSARRKSSPVSGRRGSTTVSVHPAAVPASARPSRSEQRSSQADTANTVATCTKTCAALQLYTHAPVRQPRHSEAARVKPSKVVGAATTQDTGAGNMRSGAQKNGSVAPVMTASARHSGGTPRVSGAAGTSFASARSSTATTASGRASGAMPVSHWPGSGHSTVAVADAPVVARPQRRASTKTSASRKAPLVQDTRVLVQPEELRGKLSTPSALERGSHSNTSRADVLWSPFDGARNAFADGAVHVAVTFAGEEAHRRQVAQAQREAYQREFWQLREELARVDEDIFQLRTRHTDLQEVQQRIEAEQQTKLSEAEAKVRKCRAFYKTLKRENKEWQDICDELQRVIREGSG